VPKKENRQSVLSYRRTDFPGFWQIDGKSIIQKRPAVIGFLPGEDYKI